MKFLNIEEYRYKNGRYKGLVNWQSTVGHYLSFYGFYDDIYTLFVESEGRKDTHCGINIIFEDKKYFIRTDTLNCSGTRGLQTLGIQRTNRIIKEDDVSYIVIDTKDYKELFRVKIDTDIVDLVKSTRWHCSNSGTITDAYGRSLYTFICKQLGVDNEVNNSEIIHSFDYTRKNLNCNVYRISHNEDNSINVYINDNDYFVVDKEDYYKIVAKDKWSIQGGYVRSTTNHNISSLHNAICEYYYDLIDIKGLTIDHIDRDKLNNRKSNFRFVPTYINSFNKDVPSITKNNNMISFRGRINYKVYSIKRTLDIPGAIQEVEEFADNFMLMRERYIDNEIKEYYQIEFERGLKNMIKNNQMDKIKEILNRYNIPTDATICD